MVDGGITKQTTIVEEEESECQSGKGGSEFTIYNEREGLVMNKNISWTHTRTTESFFCELI